MSECLIMPIGGPSSLLKNRDWVRPKSKIHSNDTQGKVIAVGTAITDRPPHRSVRAELPHTAPTLDEDD